MRYLPYTWHFAYWHLAFCAYTIDPVASAPRVVPYTRADIRVRVDPVTFETQLAFFRDDDDSPASDVFFIVD